ncbi:hypothetical protein [Burkholderia latens]|uniref:hypothetical protein n=1 Tax=Burkholderia latens TaxID=488446 RepID=UPI0039A4A0C3
MSGGTASRPAAACHARAATTAYRAGIAIVTPRQALGPTIVKMPPGRVLAGLRIQDDDLSTYQGYRRYAEIVATRAPNAQDARFFVA